MIADRVVISR